MPLKNLKILQKKPSFGSKSTSNSVQPIFIYAILIFVIAGLGVSIYSIISVNNMKRILNPTTINVEDFMTKVTGHTELSALKDVAPQNIIQINSNNLATLQTQVQGLNINHLGKFLIQYPDRIVLYDHTNDLIESQIPIQQQQPLPENFLTNLYAHEEVAGLQGVNPVGGILDATSLTTLKQQFPDVYKDAKVGDFLLRYPTALVIYDYNEDRLVNAVPLEQSEG